MEIDIDDNSYKNATFLNKKLFSSSLLMQTFPQNYPRIEVFKAVSLKTSQFVHKSHFFLFFCLSK